jgi:hypothetical protein
LPKPRAKTRGLIDIAVAPDVAAKLAVLESFAAAAISKSELARRLGKDEKKSAASSIRSTRPNCRRSRLRSARSASGWWSA